MLSFVIFFINKTYLFLNKTYFSVRHLRIKDSLMVFTHILYAQDIEIYILKEHNSGTDIDVKNSYEKQRKVVTYLSVRHNITNASQTKNFSLIFMIKYLKKECSIQNNISLLLKVKFFSVCILFKSIVCSYHYYTYFRLCQTVLCSKTH